MLFQIVSKRTGTILSDNLTFRQVIKKISCYFYEIDDYVMESVLFAEKEFLIRAKDKSNQTFVEKNKKDFTVLVRRIQ